MQACWPPATPPGIVSLTIRKPSTKRRKIDDDDFERLFEEGSKEQRRATDTKLAELYKARDLREFFRYAVKSRKTICVCGPTGSGKTDMLKRFLGEIPEGERIITIEDTAEFGDAGPANRVNLFYGDGRAKLAAEDIVEASLRMRPDRIIMQEVRGKEAFAFLRGLVSGHSGMTTWHAEEGQEWDALELMVRQHPAGREIPEVNIRRYLQTYIDVLVYVRKDENVYKAGRIWAKGITQ
jgi:type IV secretion system protein VirB11